MNRLIIFILLISVSLLGEEKNNTIEKENVIYHKKFYGVWVIHRYLYGSKYDGSSKREELAYYHKYVVKNPKLWLGKRIIIDGEQINFPDPLKKYDRYHDSRECSFAIKNCTFRPDLRIATFLQMGFENDPAPERIGFNTRDRYLYVENPDCSETPFDKMFLINEKELVFSFGAVFFIAKKKG